MKRRALVCVLLTACSEGPAPPLPVPEPTAPRRGRVERSQTVDTVLVTIETTRADRVGPLYGHPRDTFPKLSRRAASGRTYTRAFANSSWTLPSIASLYTGLSPIEHGVHRVDQQLPVEVSTLGEHLHAQGVQAAFFGVNPVFVVDRGLADGFDHWQAEVGWSAGRLNQSAISWLDQHRDVSKPLFLHIHYFDPHCPYIPPDAVQVWPALTPTGRAVPANRFDELGGCYGISKPDGTPELDVDVYLDRYDRELLAVDDQLDRLLTRLAERGVLGPEDRLIVTSDHGEAFWEHDDYGHSHTLWGETTHVPLIVWDASGEGVVQDPVGLADLFVGLRSPRGPVRPELHSAGIVQHTTAFGPEWTAAISASDKWMSDGTRVWTGSPTHDPLDTRVIEHDAAPPAMLRNARARARSAPPLAPSDEERELLRALGYSF